METARRKSVAAGSVETRSGRRSQCPRVVWSLETLWRRAKLEAFGAKKTAPFWMPFHCFSRRGAQNRTRTCTGVTPLGPEVLPRRFFNYATTHGFPRKCLILVGFPSETDEVAPARPDRVVTWWRYALVDDDDGCCRLRSARARQGFLRCAQRCAPLTRPARCTRRLVRRRRASARALHAAFRRRYARGESIPRPLCGCTSL